MLLLSCTEFNSIIFPQLLSFISLSQFNYFYRTTFIYSIVVKWVFRLISNSFQLSFCMCVFVFICFKQLSTFIFENIIILLIQYLWYVFYSEYNTVNWHLYHSLPNTFTFSCIHNDAVNCFLFWNVCSFCFFFVTETIVFVLFCLISNICVLYRASSSFVIWFCNKYFFV